MHAVRARFLGRLTARGAARYAEIGMKYAANPLEEFRMARR
jgi:hypothetical protein